ncbi:MAG: hypothetical protein LC776_03240 [Acidobacteria bacterium]|nr:hypothetical protein [Acidobacteriota bacterium]
MIIFEVLADLVFGTADYIADLIKGRPDYLTRLNNALAESHREDQRREAAREQKEKQTQEEHRRLIEEDPVIVRCKKKMQFIQELDDAEWILAYERRLAKLQERVAAETNRTGERGRSPKRLQKLQSHLLDVRSSIKLD